MSANLITTILRHDMRLFGSQRGAHDLTIQVFFLQETKKYQMKFDNTPPGETVITTYINDIRYMPKTILEFIKLIHLNYDTLKPWEVLPKLELILKGTLEEDLKEEVKQHNDFLKNLKNDETFYKLGLAEKKIQKLETILKEKNAQLEKQMVETKDLVSEMDSLREKAGTAELRRASNELQHKKALEQSKKETEIERTNYGAVVEKNKRLLEMVNNEKLKTKNLENNLSDMTALYESLLETTY